MPGSHDLSVENLRLHERIAESENHIKHVVKTATSTPTAKYSVRPPAKPATVVRSRAHSKAGSKAGSKQEVSEHDKEVLVVTVIEEEDEEENLPPKAPSLASKHKNAREAKPPASKVSSQHSKHSRKWDVYHIPVGIPLPPGFSKLPEIAGLSSLDDEERNKMALVKIPVSSPPRSTASGAAVSLSNLIAKRFPASSNVSSSHHSKNPSQHSKTKALESRGGGGGGGSGSSGHLRDVVFEEVREVTRRRYVVKMSADEIGGWRV
ncbi:hypothetical protein KCU77_g251, partial [Aureobasidium melanogenum]